MDECPLLRTHFRWCQAPYDLKFCLNALSTYTKPKPTPNTVIDRFPPFHHTFSETKQENRRKKRRRDYHSEFLVEDGLDRVGIRLGLSEVVLDSELSVIPGRVGLGNDLEELGADIQSFLGVTETIQ